MTRELFVVCALRDSVRIDAAEFDDEDPAFLKCDELPDTGIVAKVVRRWVGADHVNRAVMPRACRSVEQGEFCSYLRLLISVKTVQAALIRTAMLAVKWLGVSPLAPGRAVVLRIE